MDLRWLKSGIACEPAVQIFSHTLWKMKGIVLFSFAVGARLDDAWQQLAEQKSRKKLPEVLGGKICVLG